MRRAIFEWVVRYKPTSSMAAVCPALRWALQRKASIDRKNLTVMAHRRQPPRRRLARGGACCATPAQETFLHFQSTQVFFLIDGDEAVDRPSRRDLGQRAKLGCNRLRLLRCDQRPDENGDRNHPDSMPLQEGVRRRQGWQCQRFWLGRRSKRANKRRQQRQAQYVSDDHAEAGDNAKLGQATIRGRGERQKSSRRPGRKGKGDANPSCRADQCFIKLPRSWRSAR